MSGYRDFLKSFFKRNESVYTGSPPKVREEIDMYVSGYRSYLLSLMNMCESPIEQLLALNLYESVKDFSGKLCVFGPDSIAEMFIQKEVIIDGNKYRPDFLLIVATDEKTRKYVIQCDGHEFHEKTKKQAARDRKRERLFIKAGYTVIRFTGSEIWANPTNCAVQVIDILDSEFGVTEAWERRYEEDMKGQ